MTTMLLQRQSTAAGILMRAATASRQRLFATKAATNINNNKRKKRSRPQLRLSQKDRIRTNNDNNIDDITTIYRVADAAATELEHRLSRAQSYIKGFWNNRTSGNSPEMDRWWWTWNTLLALAPAAAIAFGMEVWGKPMVEQKSRELEADRLEKLGLGGDDDEEYDEDDNSLEDPKLSPVESEGTLPATPDGTTTAAATTTNVLQRLAALEQKLERQNRQLERQAKYRKQRHQQSGIQNRREDVLLQKANDEEPVMTKQQTVPTVSDMVWMTVQENLRAKSEAVVDFGKSVLSMEQNDDDESMSTRKKARDEPVVRAATTDATVNQKKYKPVEAEPVIRATTDTVNQATLEAVRSAQQAADHALVAAQAAQQVANEAVESSQKGKSSWVTRIFGSLEKHDDESTPK